MEPSEELRSVVLRLYRALEGGDVEAMARRFSAHEGMVAIGTDPAEWWTDHAELVGVWRAQVGELAGWQWRSTSLQTWSEGTTGWFADSPELTVVGQVLSIRATGVLHLEHDEWKVVQWHLSIGVANEDSLGVELTTSMEAIAEQAAAEQPDLDEATSPEGTVTILFTDIENSSVLTESLGDLRWMELLGEHNQRVQEQVDATGGFVVKTQGD